VVKGLAKQGNCLRHGQPAEHVDAGLFARAKSGYSPMTTAMITDASGTPVALRQAGALPPVASSGGGGAG
jgi:hypothetical protein